MAATGFGKFSTLALILYKHCAFIATRLSNVRAASERNPDGEAKSLQCKAILPRHRGPSQLDDHPPEAIRNESDLYRQDTFSTVFRQSLVRRYSKMLAASPHPR
jgi:hypothetical protein